MLSNVAIRLINVNGQVVLSRNYSSFKEKEITTSLPDGMYIIEFNYENSKITQRILLSN